MKKKIVALLAVVSMMAVGCSNNNGNNNGANNNNKKTASNDYITEERVNEIVLADTPNGNVVEFSLDEDDAKPNYDVTVKDGDTTYEYEIDAITGDVLKKETKTEKTNIDTTGLIGEDKAKAKALEIVPNGTIVSIELDSDENIPYYDVKVTDGEFEYEYEINAKDSSIITQSKERIDD